MFYQTLTQRNNMKPSEKIKLTRCGNCGDWQQDPELYSEQEQNEAELIHCGCENIKEVQYVTRDMAIDAGDLSLEGTIY